MAKAIKQEQDRMRQDHTSLEAITSVSTSNRKGV